MKLPKQFRQSTAMLFGLLLLFTVISCDNDDDSTPVQPTDNIVALAQGNSDLSSLVAALTKYPDLVATLQTGEFTVFAPTNAAFDNALAALGQNSIDDLPEAVLREILSYHVIPNAAVLSSSLENGAVETVQGEEIEINVDNGVVLNGSTNVTTPDVEATNGVVHVVDAVLLQPSIRPIVGTIVAPAYFNQNFTTLIAAVQAASPNILTTLLNDDQKTLFAPTNEAFVNAGITELPDQATLDAVLTYHVIGATVRAEDIAEGSSSTATLGGEIFLSNNGDAGIFINGTSQVTTPNIEGSNGVVHVINRTLLPPSSNIAEVAIAAGQTAEPEFTQLVAALTKVPSLLAAAQDAEADLTVFAPTDAAFEALYTALNVADLDALEAAIGNDKLAEVLQHHIVGANVFSTDLSSGAVTTLNQDLTVNTTALTVADASGTNTATLQAMSLNILATNGVIHVIDEVLVPNGIL